MRQGEHMAYGRTFWPIGPVLLANEQRVSVETRRFTSTF
jgi:hypothetical protein